MSIVIGADAAGLRLKEVVKNFLEKENFHVVDVTAEGQDFVDVTLAVAAEVNKEEQNLGIVSCCDHESYKLNVRQILLQQPFL